MTKHLQRDMDELQQDILTMSSLVEEMIDMAARSLLDSNTELAADVASADQQIDQREVRIEEECLKMLALHQPVAVDLRRIAAVLKVNNDLERMADLAVNIAERARSIDAHAGFCVPLKMERMVNLTMQMVRSALDAFVRHDPDAAREIMRLDDEVDELNVEIIDHLRQEMHSRPEMIEPALHCFSAVRHLERIADHATNIAEDVIYLVEGEIIRHQPRHSWIAT